MEMTTVMTIIRIIIKMIKMTTIMIKTNYMLYRFSQMEALLLIPILLKGKFLLVRIILRGTMEKTLILRMFLTIVRL